MTQLLREVFESEILKHSKINREANTYVLTESKGLWGRTVFQHEGGSFSMMDDEGDLILLWLLRRCRLRYDLLMRSIFF